MAILSSRISKQMEKEIEEYAEEEELKRSEALRKIIECGLKEIKLEKALELYRKGKITLWKASKLADISLWEMMEEARDRKIPLKYTEEDAEKDLRLAFGG